MSEIAGYLSTWQGWLWVAFAGVLGLAIVLAVVNHRLRGQNRHLTAALNHMSQGLCMYDGAERLLLANQPYMEMYGFSSEIVKPGCTLRDVLDHRVALGTLTGDAADYRTKLLTTPASGQSHQQPGELRQGPDDLGHQPADARAAAGSAPTRTSPSSAGSSRNATRWPRWKNGAPWSRRRSRRFAAR